MLGIHKLYLCALCASENQDLGSIKSSTNAAGFTFCVSINAPEDLLYLSVQYCPVEVLHRIDPLHVLCFTISFIENSSVGPYGVKTVMFDFIFKA